MSDLSRTVEIIFEGTDAITGTLDGISSNMDKFGSGLQDFASPFEDITKAVLALDAAIVGIAVAGMKMSGDIDAEAIKMAKSLGLPKEEAEKFKEVALDVYSAGYGDDMAAAFEAVTLAQQKLGDNAETDIGKVSEQALVLQKTFGVDLNDSLGAVSTLMSNFGLTSQQAMDLLTTGYQKNLDGSGDFLDSIKEYSTQFANGGADAGQFFSVLESGFSEGMLGTDKAADMFKEFRVRIQDESKTTNDALKTLGIDPVEFAKSMASGETTAIEAFDIIKKALNETENKTVQFNAGVALMGTQFEDMGQSAALAISTTATSIGDMQGAINGIDVKTFEESMSASFRTIATEFGEMKQWDVAREKIATVFADIAAAFGPAMEGVDFSGLEGAVGEIWNKIQAVFTDNNLDLTSVEGMQNAIEIVIGAMEGLADVTSGMIDVFEPIFGVLVDLAKDFNSISPEVKEFAGQIVALGTAMGLLGGVISVGGGIVGSFAALAGVFSSGGALASGLSFIVALLTGPAGLVISLGLAAAAVASFAMSSIKTEMQIATKAIEDQASSVKILTDQIKELPAGVSTVEIWTKIEAGDLEGAQGLITELTEEQKIIDLKAEADSEAVTDMTTKLSEIPPETQADILAKINSGSFDDVEQAFENIIDGKTVAVDTKTDTASLTTTKNDIDTIPKVKSTNVDVKSSGVDTVKNEVASIPENKMIEIQLQGDIDIELARINATMSEMNTTIEWTAKMNIAEIQADAEVAKASFDSVAESVTATASAAADMFSALMGAWGDIHWDSEKNALLALVREQMAMEQQALDMQKDLLDAQIAYLEAKADALRNGDGLIKITSDGLEPYIEAFMFKILEKVQVRVNEEGLDMLIGADI